MLETAKTEGKVIVSLQSENVKRIKAIRIQPDGALVVISGDNGAGKTSVLDSIEYALGGEKSLPPEAIRRGEKGARVVIDLGDLVVTRKWTPKGTSLTVAAKDGARYPSPQAILDKLVGSLSFDPLAFAKMKPAAQLETLRRLVGLDFTAAEAERKRLYDERTLVNRQADQAKARTAAMPQHDDAPAEPVSLSDLLAEQDGLNAKLRERDALAAQANERTREREQALFNVATADDRVSEIDAKIADLQKKREAWAAAKQRAEQAAADAKDAQVQAQAAVDAFAEPDFADVRRRIGEVEQTNAKVRENADRAKAQREADEHKAKSDALTAKIDALDKAKAAAIAAAAFPVEGLSVGESGVTFADLPFEQASGAEQLRVSLAMGIALNPKLRVLLIRDGSLLDAESLAIVAEMAQAAGAQVWLERVGKGAGGVVIEDGEVAGAVAS